MKPARSSTWTASLPHEPANAIAAAIVSSDAVIGRMISTSFIIGAGLKKWMPQTCSGRFVAIASSTTGSVEVFVARIASGCTIWSSWAKSVLLDRHVLHDALDHEVAVASALRSSVTVIRPRIAWRSSSVSLLPGDLLGEPGVDAGEHRVGTRPACVSARPRRTRRGRRPRRAPTP